MSKLITILSLIFRDGQNTVFVTNMSQNPLLQCPLCEVLLHFWNFKHDLRKHQMDTIFLASYRDKLFPFLIVCFLVHESSIAAFNGTFVKIYDSKGNVPQDISLFDLDIVMC